MDNNYHENKNSMYQFPTQHHYPHHIYTQCPANVDHSKLQNVNLNPEAKFPSFLPQNVVLEEQLHVNEPPKTLEAQFVDTKDDKKKKNATRRPKTEKSKSGETKKIEKSVDTSTFTIEERLVAAVWIHERHHTHDTITEIKDKFLRRFSRDPPSKTTLFAWERKLFATGNVCDAPRPGRPEKRKSHVPEVAASIKSSPALSLRARAAALRLPRTTLHNIMKNDLTHDHNHKDKPQDRPPPKRRVKQPPRKNQPLPGSAPLPAAPLEPPPMPPSHTHMHYVMHAMHTHGHTHAYS